MTNAADSRLGGAKCVGARLPLHRLGRLQDEAETMLGDLSSADWLALLAAASGAAVVGTVQSKARGLCRVGESIASNTYRAAASIRAHGLREAAALAPCAARKATLTQLNSLRRVYDELTRMGGRQRRDAILDILLAGAVAYFIAGGADAEGGLPDLDLVLGIGSHRNPFSHTILLALSVEVSVRLFVAVLAQLHERLPQKHDPLWDRALALHARVHDAAIVGVWLGTASHLLKDAGLPWAGVKPMVGLPVPLNVATHKALFAGNAFLAATLGGLTFLGRGQHVSVSR